MSAAWKCPTIARRGKDSVLIQLPGVKDPERAIDVIGKTAQLEFKLFDKRQAALLRLAKPWPQGLRQERDPSGRGSYFVLPDSSRDAVAEALAPHVPRGSAVPPKAQSRQRPWIHQPQPRPVRVSVAFLPAIA